MMTTFQWLVLGGELIAIIGIYYNSFFIQRKWYKEDKQRHKDKNKNKEA